MRQGAIALLVMGAIGASGCASVGPKAVYQGTALYNQAIVDSIDEQFLLNIVRLRYRDNPFFVQVGSITESLTVQGSAGVGYDVKPPGDELGVDAGVTYKRSPTVSYQPLQGQAFLQALMRPVRPEALLALSQSGWSVERLFVLAVEKMNTLYNAPTASGPTPECAPDYEEFQEAARLLRELQQAKQIELVGRTTSVPGEDEVVTREVGTLPVKTEKTTTTTKATSSKKEEVILRLIGEDGQNQRDLRKLLTVTGSEIVVKPARLGAPEDQLHLRTRSIFGILFLLSQNVEIPKRHEHLVTTTKTTKACLAKSTGAFDWDQVLGGDKDLVPPKKPFFKVYEQSDDPAEEAAVKIRYRGNWFFIQDTDHDSKSTFMLLAQLFNLLAGETASEGPTLTIPVG